MVCKVIIKGNWSSPISRALYWGGYEKRKCARFTKCEHLCETSVVKVNLRVNSLGQWAEHHCRNQHITLTNACSQCLQSWSRKECLPTPGLTGSKWGFPEAVVGDINMLLPSNSGCHTLHVAPSSPWFPETAQWVWGSPRIVGQCKNVSYWAPLNPLTLFAVLFFSSALVPT